MEKIFFIAKDFFVETGDVRELNGITVVDAKFRVSGCILNGAISFDENKIESERSVIVGCSVISKEGVMVDVGVIHEATGIIVNNHSGIANILGNAFLNGFFDAKF